MTPSDADPVLRADDIVATYKVSRSAAYRLLRLHGFRVGSCWRIRTSRRRATTELFCAVSKIALASDYETSHI